MNKLIKYSKIIIAVILLTIIMLPVNVNASNKVLDPICKDYLGVSADQKPTVCQDNTDQTIDNNSIFGKNGIMTKVINLLSIAVGVVAIIMIIVGGLKYVLSNGDSKSVNGAKNTILYAIIGLVISVLAQGIIVFVLNRV